MRNYILRTLGGIMDIAAILLIVAGAVVGMVLGNTLGDVGALVGIALGGLAGLIFASLTIGPLLLLVDIRDTLHAMRRDESGEPSPAPNPGATKGAGRFDLPEVDSD